MQVYAVKMGKEWSIAVKVRADRYGLPDTAPKQWCEIPGTAHLGPVGKEKQWVLLEDLPEEASDGTQ
jgi:hypothetical protein